MRVLIVVAKQVSMSSYQIPLGIGYVSASLKRAGHDVRVLNPNHSFDPQDILLSNAIRQHVPQVFATGGMALHLSDVRSMVGLARSLLPDMTILLGGPLVTSQPEVAMSAIPQADVGVVGEGEHTAVELLAALDSGSELDDLPGLIYRQPNRGLKRTAARPIENNLDALPWVDWDGLGLDVYAGLHHPGDVAPGLIIEPGARVLPLMTSRGCPYGCTFCCHEAAGRRYRTRSLDDLFAEIQSLVNDYSINALNIYDDLFCLRHRRLEEFCERIRPLGLRWACSLRAEQVTPQNLRIMKASGCVAIGFGVESMSPTILKSMKKKTTREVLDQKLNIGYEEKITAGANLIFGDPAETLDTAQESLDWWAENNRYELRMAFIGYHPGSRIYDDAVRRGLIPDPVAFLDRQSPEINGTALSDGQYMLLRQRVQEHGVSFGFPGRVLELHRCNNGLFFVRSICPHCNTEQSHLDIGLDPRIIFRISCKQCAKLYRYPIRFRNRSSDEFKDLLSRIDLLVRPYRTDSAVDIPRTLVDEILGLCGRLLKIDNGNDEAWALGIQLVNALGDADSNTKNLRSAICANPFKPMLFEQMHDHLAKLGHHDEGAKYARQASLLRARGIFSAIDVELA